MHGCDTVVARIGGADDTSPGAAAEAGFWLALVAEEYPGVPICLAMDGYDDDPRSLWEVEAARAYIVSAVRSAGVQDWRSPLVTRFNQATVLLLAMCGALGDNHPYVLVIDPAADPL